MHTFMRISRTWGAVLPAVLAVLLVFGSGAAWAVTFDLTSKAGSTLLPGNPVPVPVWGYVDTLTNPAVTQPGGPVLIVNEGDSVTVNLTNTLTVATGMLFQGQAMVPDTTGAPAGGTKTYTFTATNPGTFLYEAGLLPNAQHQAAMGLYGALVVRPAVAGQAYADAGTAFNDEAVLVVSELDPGLNNSATPAAFDMRNYAPRYFLINGKAYPDTDAIIGNAGNKLLLRYLNAGIQHHSMGVLGLRQIFVAKDGSVLAKLNHNVVAETLAPGQTGDAIATVPLATTNGSKFAIYDGSMMLHNNGASNAFGGMLTFVTVGTPTPDNTGPAASNVTLSPSQTNVNATIGLNATISDVSNGGQNVTAAEYFIDTTGPAGSGNSMSIAPASSPTVTASAAILATTVTALSNGNHNVYVRGQDELGAWGAFGVAVLKVDRVGPATTLLTLTPNSSNGGVAVGMTATANDSSSGGSSIAAAEYAIDGGTAVAMTVNTTSAAVASLSATVSAATINGLSNGDHNVTVRSQDALGNFGPNATVVLHVVKTGPITSGVVANPSPNNGMKPLSVGQPVVRITATMTSAGSTVSAAEAFIDAVGTTSTGFPLLPSDGVFNGAIETGFVDVPLTTINNLSTGNHTLYVRGKDATGNWGTAASGVLVIERTPPTFTGISLAPNPTLGATSVTMTVNGAADANGVVGGEYWIDRVAPAPGAGTPFTGLAPAIPVAALATGNHTVGARVRDGAGNWSTTASSATVFVVPDAIFSNGFETGTTVNSWGWSSDTGANNAAGLAQINATSAAALVGARGLQVQGNTVNYVQFNFGTGANPVSPTYDARFYFNPHGNTGNDQDILVARTTGGATVFRVRYSWNAGSPQVQVQVGTGTGNTAWTGITNGASNRIEVVWQSGGTLQLFVGASPVAAQTLTATATSVGQVRLGSVTAGANNIVEYFDAFSSKRTVTPYGP